LYSYYLQDAVVEWVLISFYNPFEVELCLASFPTSKGSPNLFDVNLHLTPTSKESPNLSSHAEVSYQGSGNLYNQSGNKTYEVSVKNGLGIDRFRSATR
ncbi:hypothetical protein, partial [Streptococcus pasteurianus]|uniref:hypothetical protein n=1 Tax=Streptococcus pasteurianus TaxID=197614 RepID=UPI000AFE6D88